MLTQSTVGLKHADITASIINGFFAVYNDLGRGFLESVYEKALAFVLAEAGLEVQQQQPIKVFFRGREVGAFRSDIVVNKLVILELKASKRLHGKHSAQMINVLNATKIEVGMLLNFGPKPEFRRILLTNDRKHHLIGIPEQKH